MNTFDIIIILIVIIVIVVLIGININSVIDNKLSKVAVNIPPITIPSPKVIVKIQKSCGSDDYDVFIEKSQGQQEEQIVSLSPINEHFSNNNNILHTTSHNMHTTPQSSKSNESSNILGNDQFNQNQHKMDKINMDPIKISPKYEDVRQTSLKNIQYPNEDSDVNYDTHSSANEPSKQEVNESSKSEQKSIPCKNESLNNQRIDSYQYLINNSKEVNNHQFPICDEHTPVDNINDPDVDILDHYRKQQVYVRGYFEDPVLRGSNVDSYDNAIALTAIGKIPLVNNFKQPKPSGYIFSDSPAYNR